MKLNLYLLCTLFLIHSLISAETFAQEKTSLHIKSTKEVGQIEIGSPYIGIEIHKSFPMLNRISFYYPVANSIDISENYWKRENFRIMSMGIKAGDSLKRILENEIYDVDQTPYSVSFTKEKFDSEIKISYELKLDDGRIIQGRTATDEVNPDTVHDIYKKLVEVLEYEMRKK